MIWELADKQFVRLMENKKLHLPIRWTGRYFREALGGILDTFLEEICELDSNGSVNPIMKEIEQTKTHLLECVEKYHNGFPAAAFSILADIMYQLMMYPLCVYQKSSDIKLYRIRDVKNNIRYNRADIFHVPASARSMISTCRYSIAGYPSLYLTTSLRLGLEEASSNSNNAIVSRFEFVRSQRAINIQVLELGIKPQDFLEQEEDYRENVSYYLRRKRLRSAWNLKSPDMREIYLRWYPVIAACSFIRADRSAPFASEYIIPQLLMQWVRTQNDMDSLMGIRYFSCASARSSELGFNYVFPASNFSYKGDFCSVLRNSFRVTEPVYLRDYFDIAQCESALDRQYASEI